MNHHEIEQNEIIERYVQHLLTADERLAFQEHYFACDECFQQVQTNARFVAGVRDASRSGVLDRARVQHASSAASAWFGWLKPVLALSVGASLILAGLLVWLWLGKVPALRQEIAREKQSREESEQASRKELETARIQIEESQRELEIERAARAKFESGIEAQSANNGGQRTGADLIAQANIPIVTLESTRDSQASENEVTVPPAAKSVVLWIPVEPGRRFESFRVQIFTKSGRLVETINAAKPNRYGALSIGLPTNRLQSDQYLVRLSGAIGQQSELLGEYDLRVVIK